MNKKKDRNSDKNQLPLFDMSKYTSPINSDSIDEFIADENNLSDSKEIDRICELIIPETYEETIQQEVNKQKIANNLALMAQFITPVIEFEEKIIQVVTEIKLSGHLLFLYGISGAGKSTFISSLEWRQHIPIKKIIPINTRKLAYDHNKIRELLNRISEETETFFKDNQQSDTDKLCIIIDYLENLQGEDPENIRAFFRDLNGLLREYPILIVWPVTDRGDLTSMQDFAESFSSTMFDRKIPVIEFTGPPIEEYPTIAKNTITFFNGGRSCYEFQLNDKDFDNLKKKYEEKPKHKRIIRDYLREVKDIWQERTKYIEKLMGTVPKPIEVWFIFSYPKAESVVAQFAKQSDNINEMWNANYNALFTYIKEHTQRKADWPPERLTLALSGILTTKIMYLPTNALVSCIAAYSKEAGINISREDFIQKYGVQEHWFSKKHAQRTLSTTPLYFQLSGRPITAGKRKSGSVEIGLKNATKPFEKINEDIVSKKISDQILNKALYLTLKDIQNELGNNLHFSCEKRHPYLTTIRPDIIVEGAKDKCIALEFCYTNDNTPGNLASYALGKLNTYMNQLEHIYLPKP